MHFPGVVKALSGIDPCLGKSMNTSGGLVAFSDATWRRSDYHSLICLDCDLLHGRANKFASKHLKVIALSSPVGEYAATSHNCREAAFVRNVLVDLEFSVQHPTMLCVDNKMQ